MYGQVRGVTIENKMKETRRRWFGGVTKEAYKYNNEKSDSLEVIGTSRVIRTHKKNCLK